VTLPAARRERLLATVHAPDIVVIEVHTPTQPRLSWRAQTLRGALET